MPRKPKKDTISPINPAFASMTQKQLESELKKAKDKIIHFKNLEFYENPSYDSRALVVLWSTYRKQLELYLEIPF